MMVELPDEIFIDTDMSDNFYSLKDKEHRTKYNRAPIVNANVGILIEALNGLATISNNPVQICNTFEYRAVRQIAKKALEQYQESGE